MQRPDRREPRGGGDLFEVHQAQRRGQHATGEDPDQHGDVGQKAARIAGDQQDDGQHDQRNQDVLRGRVKRVRHAGRDAQSQGRVAVHQLGFQPRLVFRIDDPGRRRSLLQAEDPVDADGHQADPDGQDHRAGDHGRKEPQHAADQGRDEDADDARADHGAEQRPRAKFAGNAVGDGDHRPDGGKGDAHHHGHLDAQPRAGAQRLDDRRDPAYEQVGRDQERHVLGGQFQRAPDDQRHGDGAGIHHQDVLQAQGEQAGRGRHRVDGIDRRVDCDFCHVGPLPGPTGRPKGCHRRSLAVGGPCRFRRRVGSANVNRT